MSARVMSHGREVSSTSYTCATARQRIPDGDCGSNVSGHSSDKIGGPLLVFLLVVVVGCGTSSLQGQADADVDIRPDAVDVTSETDPCTPGLAGGDCNVVEQCGCTEPGHCSIEWGAGFECDIGEGCWSGIFGTAEEGDPCISEACRPGTICKWTPPPSSALCHKWCRADEDCSLPESTCSVSIEGLWEGRCDGLTDFPYKLRSLP